jgi:hypothetical protein
MSDWPCCYLHLIFLGKTSCSCQKSSARSTTVGNINRQYCKAGDSSCAVLCCFFNSSAGRPLLLHLEFDKDKLEVKQRVQQFVSVLAAGRQQQQLAAHHPQTPQLLLLQGPSAQPGWPAASPLLSRHQSSSSNRGQSRAQCKPFGVPQQQLCAASCPLPRLVAPVRVESSPTLSSSKNSSKAVKTVQQQLVRGCLLMKSSSNSRSKSRSSRAHQGRSRLVRSS